MKKIYIILTHTGTLLSNIIKFYTKDEFSHVSISLDENLNEMYSFGRLHPYNPIWGGFVHEQINKGIFKRFKYTIAEVYSLNIEDSQYDIINQLIKNIKESPKPYKFNFIGLVAVSLNKNIHIKRSFYCAEFVKYLFEQAHIPNNLPDIVKPQDFKDLKGIQLIYGGFINKYTKNKNSVLNKIKENINFQSKKEGIIWVEAKK